MKTFFHSDADGRAAAVIVYKYYIREERTLEDFQFIGINYDVPFPFDKIVNNELVIIVDFSLQNKGDFTKLKQITSNIIWIDHHITAINKHSDIELEGIRRDGTAACVLTWEYFYPHQGMPYVIKLLADYDVWTFHYGENTNYLQTGIKMYDTRPESSNWIKWLDPEYVAVEEINKGQELIDYRNIMYKGFAKSSYLGKFKGWFNKFKNYKLICCNSNVASSQLFDSIKTEYDIMVRYNYNGEIYNVSLYTANPDIDVSEIALKYGGGGHKAASGFSCKHLPFVKLK
jgi:oligoribonuclease NrnB/cAMP/cGMP phosphodiesterase (DHH superfamily)